LFGTGSLGITHGLAGCPGFFSFLQGLGKVGTSFFAVFEGDFGGLEFNPNWLKSKLVTRIAEFTFNQVNCFTTPAVGTKDTGEFGFSGAREYQSECGLDRALGHDRPGLGNP
jgi:hypothetical protein